MSLRVALTLGSTVRHRLPEDVLELCRLSEARLIGHRATPVQIHDRMALIGWAFHREGLGACDTLDDEAVAQIRAQHGSWALRHLWGNFLLAWADDAGAIWLLRSPPSGQGVYRACSKNAAGDKSAVCIFTDLALARALGFRFDRPDPEAIDAHIRFPLLRGRATGIADVSEILPGEVIDVATGSISDASWSPWNHVAIPPRHVPPDELHACVSGIVRAWATRFGRLQLELSGGLDSSIVAACLRGRETPWRAVNLATPGVPGDERVYARTSAERAGVEMVEIVMSDELGDPFALLVQPRARPGGFGLLGESDAALLNAARDFGAEAIFTGVGGDNVFGYIRKAGPVVDALKYAGPRTAWRAAGDLAVMTGDSIWRALWLAARRLVTRPRLWPRDPSLLSTRYDRLRPDHPWLEVPHGIAPGQFSYGRALLPIQPFVDGYDRAFAMPMIAPLLSQPLVELGLEVASWKWCQGGHDRSLARQAFAEELAPVVRDRRTKGRVESLFVPTFNANRSRLRGFLLDGWLASAGILDVDAVNAALDPPADALDAVYIRLLQIADVERWVRSL